MNYIHPGSIVNISAEGANYTGAVVVKVDSRYLEFDTSETPHVRRVLGWDRITSVDVTAPGSNPELKFGVGSVVTIDTAGVQYRVTGVHLEYVEFQNVADGAIKAVSWENLTDLVVLQSPPAPM